MKLNAILVKLSISVFPNQRQDRDITAEVKLKKALGNGAGKWVKYKLPDEALEPLRKYCGFVRQFHYDHTSIWEEGLRLLSAKARENYDARMKEFADEFWKNVDEFGTHYPAWIEHAKIMHAGTFDPDDYPAWPDCRQMFQFGREYFPVPKAEHFDTQMQALYGTALEAITEKKVSEAVADTWERLIKPVAAMADKLSSPDAIFRDTLVGNVKEMAELIPALNLTNDPKLAEAAQLIGQQLANLDVQTLRDSKVDRKEAAEKAKNLVARFGALGQRKLAA